jgi:ribose-phosphate pyrophosphokinase
MAVRIVDPSALHRPRARALADRPQRATSGPVVLVARGCERFVSGLGRGSFARAAVGRFPNGELHTEVPSQVEDRACVVVGSTSPPAGNVERLTLVAHALRRAGAERITALLPYLAYARQDRAMRTESLGLAWIGEMLCGSGISAVVCVDVHSGIAGEVLGLALTSLSPAELLAGALPEAWRAEVTFVAPDEGAVDRCAAVAGAAGVDRPVVWARKRRTRTGVEHYGLVGSPSRRAVVVDDILDTGDTLVSCCRQLRDAGVRQIGVIATHGLFTGERWRALFSEGVHEVWITDTVLSRRRPPRVHIVPVAPLLGRVLEQGSDLRRF